MQLTIVLFDGITALDAVGGYEVLVNVPNIEVEFAATDTGLVAADSRRLGLSAYRRLDDIARTDIVYVPGGPGVVPALDHQQLIHHIGRLARGATWTIGICSGVALLGAAGLIDGKTVATNWGWRERVASYGARVVTDRYHLDGNLVTAAGVSASIDAGLFVAGLLAGEDIARIIGLGIEYYPRPPFGAATADDEPAAFRDIVLNHQATAAAHKLAALPPF